MLPSGGGIRVLREFTEHLSSKFSLSLHVPAGGSLQPAESSIPETVYPYPMWRRPSGFLRPVAPLFLVLRLLSFKKVCRTISRRINDSADIALVHNSMPVAAPPVLQYLSIPSAYFCFEHPRHIYEKDIIRRTDSDLAELALKPLSAIENRIDRLSAVSATKIVTFSEYMRSKIETLYNRQALMVRPGVDSTFFRPADPAVIKGSYVLSVGALWPFKGHEKVIRIIGLLQEDLRPELKIVADREYPGYSAKLFSLADSLSVKVTVHKNITDIMLRDLYRGAHAVICCQRNEPYGLVPLEAMASGTPVIALREGGFTDNITHGLNGFLFSGDVEEAARFLLKIMTDPATAAAFVSEGIMFTGKERTIAEGAKNLGEILEAL